MIAPSSPLMPITIAAVEYLACLIFEVVASHTMSTAGEEARGEQVAMLLKLPSFCCYDACSRPFLLSRKYGSWLLPFLSCENHFSIIVPALICGLTNELTHIEGTKDRPREPFQHATTSNTPSITASRKQAEEQREPHDHFRGAKARQAKTKSNLVQQRVEKRKRLFKLPGIQADCVRCLRGKKCPTYAEQLVYYQYSCYGVA